MREQTKYFGYGANRDPQMMEAITGNGNLAGRKAVLKDFQICIQRLDQVPPKAQKILRKAGWTDETFSTYTIRPDEGNEDSLVHGMIWELTEHERNLVRNWELVGLWYKETNCQVMADQIIGEWSLIDVITEQLGDGQKIKEVADGTNYKTFLNDREVMFGVAREARRQYIEREGIKYSGKER